MNSRLALVAASLAALLAAPPAAVAQPAGPAGPPKTPVERFQSAREHYLDARFELAAEDLKLFLAANPADADFLEIEKKFGPTVFEKLTLVPYWSEDAAANAEAVKAVGEIVSRAREVNRKFFRDPARIRKYIRNLGATAEERAYAIEQLRLSGDAVAKPLIAELRDTMDTELESGIFTAIGRLGPDVIPGVLAALEGLSDAKRLGILRSVAGRADLPGLVEAADTDPLPWLWYFSSAPADQVSLRAGAITLLDQMLGGVRQRRADVELLALAKPNYEGTAKFAAIGQDPDRFPVWSWDFAANDLKIVPMTKAEAEEYFGLRNLRWAVERNPANVSAQDMYLALATDRAVNRAGFGLLMVREPAVYQLLAASSSSQITRLLDSAIAGQRTAEVMGFTQMLADRADRTSANPTEVKLPDGRSVTKPPALVRALDYPDPRVQLAAAVGLVRSPGPPTHGRQARVVEVLRRTLAADPPPGDANRGRALIGDPSAIRAARTASYLRSLGYGSERYPTGKDLSRRIAQASDFDLIVIDRHLAGPMVRDVLASLKADANAAGRPVLLVASADQVTSVPLERLLLRLAVLVAVTEVDEPPVTPPFSFDPTKPPPRDIEAARKRVQELRDAELADIAETRLARLRRLIVAADFPPSPRLDELLALRLPQYTYAVLATEFPITPDSAPLAFNSLNSYTRQIQARPQLALAAQNVSTITLGRLIDELTRAVDDPRRARAEAIRQRLPLEDLLVPEDNYRDLALEFELKKLAAGMPNVTVIPEPFGLNGLTDEVKAATADPGQAPRDPDYKRRSAKQAIEWLRRIALGDVPGYDVRPAEPALRQALWGDDELADPAIDALARIPSAEVQQDLLVYALDTKRPLNHRLRAADRTVLHMQSFGRFIPADLANALAEAARTDSPEGDLIAGDLRGKFLILHQLVSGKADDLPMMFNEYRPPTPKPSGLGDPAAPKDEPEPDLP